MTNDEELIERINSLAASLKRTSHFDDGGDARPYESALLYASGVEDMRASLIKELRRQRDRPGEQNGNK